MTSANTPARTPPPWIAEGYTEGAAVYRRFGMGLIVTPAWVPGPDAAPSSNDRFRAILGAVTHAVPRAAIEALAGPGLVQIRHGKASPTFDGALIREMLDTVPGKTLRVALLHEPTEDMPAILVIEGRLGRVRIIGGIAPYLAEPTRKARLPAPSKPVRKRAKR